MQAYQKKSQAELEQDWQSYLAEYGHRLSFSDHSLDQIKLRFPTFLRECSITSARQIAELAAVAFQNRNRKTTRFGIEYNEIIFIIDCQSHQIVTAVNKNEKIAINPLRSVGQRKYKKKKNRYCPRPRFV